MPHAKAPIATNPTLADGEQNVLTDLPLGFDGVVSYSIDGTGNNSSDPSLGATNTDEARLAPANFASGSTDTPVDGPNPRLISNTIFDNDPNNNDPGGRSAYTYAFGQFMTSTLTQTSSRPLTVPTH
jgi:hypothetical protein